MRLEWTDTALDDLAAIRDYIAKDSPYYARHFLAQIFDTTGKLMDFPELGRQVPEAGDRSDVRELIFRSYRIMYLVEPHRLVVVAVIHGSRDIGGLASLPWDT